MKKLLLVLLLTGCSTVPVERKFPEVPTELLAGCPSLKKVDVNDHKLSSTLTVVTDNYALYKECKIKDDSWIQWYNEQKKIFEEVN
jgi:hypothetical protein